MESSNLSENKDLYQILSVSRDATPDDIASAYKNKLVDVNNKLSSSDEPSENSQHPDFEQLKFTNLVSDIQSAYNVLMNPEQRAEYDKKYSPLVEDCDLNTKIEEIIKSKLGRQNITEVFKVPVEKDHDYYLNHRGFGNRLFENTNKDTLFSKVMFSVFKKDLEELNKNQWHPSVFFISLVTSLLAGIGFIITVRFFFER